MNRRSKEVRGFVNFPVDNENYKNTGEGGMFVQLVVRGVSHHNGWPVCCGMPNVTIQLSECLMGSGEHHDTHFPFYHDDDAGTRRYESIPYLSVVTLGSTGWSGYHEAHGEYFQATYHDLTDEGKKLYDLMQTLYPNCKVELLTWLDT